MPDPGTIWPKAEEVALTAVTITLQPVALPAVAAASWRPKGAEVRQTRFPPAEEEDVVVVVVVV